MPHATKKYNACTKALLPSCQQTTVCKHTHDGCINLSLSSVTSLAGVEYAKYSSSCVNLWNPRSFAYFAIQSHCLSWSFPCHSTWSRLLMKFHLMLLQGTIYSSNHPVFFSSAKEPLTLFNKNSFRISMLLLCLILFLFYHIYSVTNLICCHQRWWNSSEKS